MTELETIPWTLKADAAGDLPLEFVDVEWDEHQVTDHDGRALVRFLREHHVYRRDDESGVRYKVATGLCKIAFTGAGRFIEGNRAFCLARLGKFPEENPEGLSADVLAMIGEFLAAV